MSWRNIRLIFHRETGDQLRDRRTLFMVVVLPLLLYPALGLGMLQMSLLFSEQPRTVVMLGADHLPEPPLLNETGNRIAEQWFTLPSDTETLNIVTDVDSTAADTKPAASAEATEDADNDNTGDAPDTEVPFPDAPGGVEVDKATVESVTDEVNEESQLQLLAAREIRTRLGQLAELRKKQATLPEESQQAAEVVGEIDGLLGEISELFAASNIQVLIIIPEGFAEYMEAENERLVQRSGEGAIAPEDRLRPTIIRNSANEKSLIAYGRVREALDSWEQAILNQRLEMANLPADLTRPVDADRLDLAKEEELAANVWSRLFPAMLIIMAMTGAFHPAIDLGAGEKERGTMETLLISPALRSEIVIGKFLTVLLFSLVTAMLNLASMGMTGLHILNSAGGGSLQGLGDFSVPPVSQLMWVAVMAVPLASLFASLSLAFALFARSSKEGQYYLTPLLTVTLGLTVFCLSPAVEITPFYSLVPVMGPALLLKGLLLGETAASNLSWYLVPVLTTSLIYSGLGLYWAMDQFQREDVLFRESERFDLRLWVRHLFRDKEATPNFSEAVFCFVLVMLLQFAMLNVFSGALNSAPPGEQGMAMVKLLVIQQLAIIASPALFMGILLTTSLKKTFQFRWPKAKFWLLGLTLPMVLHPLAVELQQRLYWFFPKLPAHAQAALATLGDSSIPWYVILLAFALAPAICEELAFRGLIMSGFRRKGRDGLAIVFSGILFGVMHMIPQQVFNASLLGLVLGLLAVKSGSIFPAMLFHFVNNALGVLHGNYAAMRETSPLLQQTTIVSEFGVQYTGWVVLLALVIAICLLTWLFRSEKYGEVEAPEST
ncbi:CPBP family intramembrane metalloprotease [bacterium]|nr:CPBP family intramembrane metalloprotease [bacterium]